MGLFDKVKSRAAYIVDLDDKEVYEVGSKEYKRLIKKAKSIRTNTAGGWQIILTIDDHVIVECNSLSEAYGIRRKAIEDYAYYEERRKISFEIR